MPSAWTTARHDRAVARVLRDLAPAELAFLRQPLEVRPDDGQQLQDDRRADVGHDAQREDRHLRQVPAREHVVEAEHRVLGLFGEQRERLGVHARRRDVIADAVHGQQPEREQHAIAQLRDREDVLECSRACVALCAKRLGRAAGGRDLLGRLAAELVGLTVSALRDLAARQHLDRRRRARDEAALAQQVRRHHGAGLEPLAERVEVDDHVLDAERVVEAALRHAPVQRHLAALEAALRVKPERDWAPLWPRPAVLPRPEPWPRPTRFFACLAPLGGLQIAESSSRRLLGPPFTTVTVADLLIMPRIAG